MAKAILALDLGTKTGFCVGDNFLQIHSTWDLKPGRHDGGGMRFLKFVQRLNEILATYPDIIVFYEEVRRHAGTDAAHVYGGLMGTLTGWCEEKGIPYSGVPVGSIKKFWTGKGNANKDLMVAECARRKIAVKDDNEADACALFWLKLEEFGDAL